MSLMDFSQLPCKALKTCRQLRGVYLQILQLWQKLASANFLRLDQVADSWKGLAWHTECWQSPTTASCCAGTRSWQYKVLAESTLAAQEGCIHYLAAAAGLQQWGQAALAFLTLCEGPSGGMSAAQLGEAVENTL